MRPISSDSMHFPQILSKLKRGPQVILPKDIGLILAYTGIGKESVCIDAGTGSGFLAVALGNVAKNVTSYEKNAQFFALAIENTKRAKLENVKILHKDIFEGIEEKDADLFTLDMADSDKAVPLAHAALKSGGYLVGYLPHAEQAQKFVSACRTAGFSEIFVLESIVREYLAREQGFRPENTGLTHTAYLAFARK
jgi:tRNA (adenine57-N1/adenine58-N1)-methyltransferase